MKIYVAARLHEKERVRELYKILKQNGHTITTDWTECVTKLPLSENPESAQRCTEHTLSGVKEADVFIFLTNPEVGAGSSMELGMALMLNSMNKLPHIYIVGPYINSHFGFYHTAVQQMVTIEDVLMDMNNVKFAESQFDTKLILISK